jgi:hypothetical protein
MEGSKRTKVVLLARQKRAVTNYYIIKPYLQQPNSILHCENLIKADWLTKVQSKIKKTPPVALGW